MEENWVNIYSADKLYKVELVKGILERNEIESVIMNKRDSEFLIGEVELFVDAKNEDKALQLISEFKKSE
nr:DUF2007 domain-containing protein [Bacteroidota bacterium]